MTKKKKKKVAQNLKFALEKIENIVGKQGNAGYQHYLFRVVKSHDSVV